MYKDGQRAAREACQPKVLHQGITLNLGIRAFKRKFNSDKSYPGIYKKNVWESWLTRQ